MADAPIEALMDALWTLAEEGGRTHGKQWRFSAEGFDRIRAAVRPGLDPFGERGLLDQTCLGIPYVVDYHATEDFVLEDKP